MDRQEEPICTPICTDCSRQRARTQAENINCKKHTSNGTRQVLGAIAPFLSSSFHAFHNVVGDSFAQREAITVDFSRKLWTNGPVSRDCKIEENASRPVNRLKRQRIVLNYDRCESRSKDIAGRYNSGFHAQKSLIPGRPIVARY